MKTETSTTKTQCSLQPHSAAYPDGRENAWGTQAGSWVPVKVGLEDRKGAKRAVKPEEAVEILWGEWFLPSKEEATGVLGEKGARGHTEGNRRDLPQLVDSAQILIYHLNLKKRAAWICFGFHVCADITTSSFYNTRPSGQMLPTVCFNKQDFIRTEPHLFAYLLSMAAFILERQSWVVMIWPAKPKNIHSLSLYRKSWSIPLDNNLEKNSKSF